jgi:D-threo-aldose 1-dehydrogenase
MQFPLAHPAMGSVIPGALSITEVEQNVAHIGRKIPTELWAELKHEKLLDPAAPVPK